MSFVHIVPKMLCAAAHDTWAVGSSGLVPAAAGHPSGELKKGI